MSATTQRDGQRSYRSRPGAGVRRIGNISPAEAEEQYYAIIEQRPIAA